MASTRHKEKWSENNNINNRIRLKNILIIRLSAMGDIVLASHAIRCLKKRFPETRITLMTKKVYEPLAACIPNINAVIGFDSAAGITGIFRAGQTIKSSHFDGIVDLQASPRSRWLSVFSGIRNRCSYRPRRWDRFRLVYLNRPIAGPAVPVPLLYLNAMRAWAVQDDGEGLHLEIPELAISPALDNEKYDRPAICLAPGAGRATKMWPGDRYAEVGQHFTDKGYRIFLVGGPDDFSVCKQISKRIGDSCLNFCGELSAIQSAALIHHSVLLISNDTGIMHIATAVGTPQIAIFGPTTEQLGFFPFRGSSCVVEHHDLDCRPCSYHGTMTCPRGHFKCMLELDPQQVITAAHALLAV